MQGSAAVKPNMSRHVMFPDQNHELRLMASATAAGEVRTRRVQALDAHLHEVEGDGAQEAHAHDAARPAVHAEGADGGARDVAELVEDAPLIRGAQQLRRAGAALWSPASRQGTICLEKAIARPTAVACGCIPSTI